MAVTTRTKTWSSGDTLTASDLNAEFDGLLGALALVNADISGSAAIAASKLESTVVITDTVQTVSGAKTFSGNNTFSGVNTITGGIKNTMTTDTDGATVTFDLDVTNLHEVTLGGNRTLAISNEDAGQVFIIKLIQDGTGSRTVTFFSTIKWAGGSAPTLTTTANKADTFGFLVTGTDTYDGHIVGLDI